MKEQAEEGKDQKQEVTFYRLQFDRRVPLLFFLHSAPGISPVEGKLKS